MYQELCAQLNLNIKAGVGRRLALANIIGDMSDPNTFYIASPKVGEAQSLADVLSVWVKTVQLSHYKFKARRIVVCPGQKTGGVDG